MAMQTDLLFTTDLDKGVAVTKLHPLLFTGDDASHRFIVSVNRDEQPENLSGTTVYGYFVRADEAMVTLEGNVDSDGRAFITLNSSCYSAPGRFQLVIRVTQGDVKTTIFCADGYMKHTTSDTIVVDENIIPSFENLLAQIDAMEEAIVRANEAADRANEAAENAGSAGGGTGEGLPQVSEADNGMPLVVENGEWTVGKLQKNAVQGLVTDFINIYGLFDAKDAAIAEKADKEHTHAYSDITGKPDTFLTEEDKQDIVNDTLSALAGADTSDAAIANLNGRVGLLERKATNMAEDIAALQYELDELETNIVYYAGTGWPIISPNGTLYAIRVNDDGSLYTGPFEPLT